MKAGEKAAYFLILILYLVTTSEIPIAVSQNPYKPIVSGRTEIILSR